MANAKLVIGIVLLLSPIALNASSTPVIYAQTGDVAPEARGGHDMVFDAVNNVSVMFGGFSYTGGLHSLDDTWTYSVALNEWSQLDTFSHPSHRAAHAMAFCSLSQKIILYGGSGHQVDTWAFSCASQQWSHLYPDQNPGPRYYHNLAYDPTENVVVLFGGFNEDGVECNETWIFDCAVQQWQQLNPETAPRARYGHVMAYDSSVGLIVLTGGNTGSEGHQDDTWVFNASASTWTQREPASGPDPLKWPSITYDVRNGKCIMFGGQIDDHLVHGTWAYDAQEDSWSRRFPLIAPPSRIVAAMAYDSVLNVSVLFGGLGSNFDTIGDTWTYEYQSDTWFNQTAVDHTSHTNGASEEPLPLLLVLGLAAIAVVLVAAAVVTSKR